MKRIIRDANGEQRPDFEAKFFILSRWNDITWAMHMDEEFEIETAQGITRGKPGDWLIRGDLGEYSVCPDNVIWSIYRPPKASTNPANCIPERYEELERWK